MLIKASDYYGRRSVGWIVLIHGQPWHFFGRNGKKEAKNAIANLMKCR